MAHTPIEEDPPTFPTGPSATRSSSATHPLLPEQMRQSRCRSDEGERRLMIAVLEDAVDCFKKHAFASDPRSRALFQDAIDWFSSEEDDWPFAFERLCEALDMNAGNIRSGLTRWKEEELQRRLAFRVREIRQHDSP